MVDQVCTQSQWFLKIMYNQTLVVSVSAKGWFDVIFQNHWLPTGADCTSSPQHEKLFTNVAAQTDQNSTIMFLEDLDLNISSEWLSSKDYAQLFMLEIHMWAG